MAHIKKDTLIHAPIRQVFDMVFDFESIPQWMVGMEKVHNISPGERGEGSAFEWVYNMAGVKFDGVSRIVSLEPLRKAVIASTGGIDSTWTWTYAAEGEGTRLTCEMEYTVPGAGLGKIADKLVVERTNAKNLEKSLANIKALAEGT
jgi:uncharacterized membrane protein